MSSSKPKDPGPAPKPVAPVTPENDNERLARESSTKSYTRRTGRRSTMMVPNASAGYKKTFGG